MKVFISYVMVLASIGLLFLVGMLFGVWMLLGDWMQMTELVLIGLIPFVGLGIALGHLLNLDLLGPVFGGGALLFAFLGGTWFLIIGDGVFRKLCELLPSYWLVQVGHLGLGVIYLWPAKAWLVMGVWLVAMIVLVCWVYWCDI